MDVFFLSVRLCVFGFRFVRFCLRVCVCAYVCACERKVFFWSVRLCVFLRKRQLARCVCVCVCVCVVFIHHTHTSKVSKGSKNNPKKFNTPQIIVNIQNTDE